MRKLRIGSMFSGVGGLDLAVEAFFGGETVWHAEIEPEPSKVLAARWPGVPNLGDVTKVPWWIVAAVDILCLGFPCQDLSLAGRRSGMRPGTRSGLWADAVKAIRALRPKVIVIENVRGLLSGCAECEADSNLGSCPRCVDPDSGVPHAPNLRALGRVLGDLASLGFDAEWVGLPASDIGAPHGRFRVFVLAYARGVRLGEGWHTAPGETAGRWSPAFTSGRGGAPLALLPTPVTEPDTGNGHARNLGKEVRLLPTPIGSDGAGGPKALDGALYSPQLREVTQLLPTPRASRGAAATETMYALGATRDDTGDRQGNVILMPTPQVADATGGHASRSGERSGELLLPGLAREITTDWGEYEPAVRLWESVTRPAPAPTLPDGKNGNHRLAAVFPEWMMGYPAGFVTDVIARNPAIKACGNGVVPQQAYEAMSRMWPNVGLDIAA